MALAPGKPPNPSRRNGAKVIHLANAPDHSTIELFHAKLESSGLSPADADALGLEALSATRAKGLGSWVRLLPALLIPYHDAAGQPVSAWPAHPPFYRLRYLSEPADATGFSVQTTGAKKFQRYVQPPNSAVAAYLPRCSQVDWLEVMAEADQPLVITEGELKAACACVRGVPTLGLGGVQNWRALSKGVAFLPELEAISWVGRHTYLCFDSDFKHNHDITSALTELGEELVRRGAYPYLVSIPQVTDLKVGLDDFLVAEGLEAFTELLTQAEPLGLTRPLFDLNERYLYVKHPSLVLDRGLGERLSPEVFRNATEAPRLYQERALRKDGSVSRMTTSAAGAWLAWPLRAEVDRLTYRPGHQGLVAGEDGAREWSLWPGWGERPTDGPVDPRHIAPFTELLDHLFVGAAPGAREWFLRWCAYPLRYPGTKLFSNVLFWGRRHGTGKSLIGYTLGAIYGKNFTEITQSDIHADFNDWAENKQLVMGDDVTGSDKRQDNDLLKKLITQKSVRINVKFIPKYVIPDCLNYFFTANHPDAFFLEDDDRRSFIHEVLGGPLAEEFYVRYDLWLASGGAAYLHRWLLDLELGDFNPAAPAFMTSAKERMISDVRSDLASWARELLDAPDAVLRVGGIAVTKDLFSNRELLRFYDPDKSTKTTANGLGRELKRAGARQVLDGAVVKLPDGGVDRLYIARNTERWLKADLVAVQKHLADWLKRQGVVQEKRY